MSETPLPSPSNDQPSTTGHSAPPTSSSAARTLSSLIIAFEAQLQEINRATQNLDAALNRGIVPVQPSPMLGVLQEVTAAVTGKRVGSEEMTGSSSPKRRCADSPSARSGASTVGGDDGRNSSWEDLSDIRVEKADERGNADAESDDIDVDMCPEKIEDNIIQQKTADQENDEDDDEEEEEDQEDQEEEDDEDDKDDNSAETLFKAKLARLVSDPSDLAECHRVLASFSQKIINLEEDLDSFGLLGEWHAAVGHILASEARWIEIAGPRRTPETRNKCAAQLEGIAVRQKELNTIVSWAQDGEHELCNQETDLVEEECVLLTHLNSKAERRDGLRQDELQERMSRRSAKLSPETPSEKAMVRVAGAGLPAIASVVELEISSISHRESLVLSLACQAIELGWDEAAVGEFVASMDAWGRAAVAEAESWDSVPPLARPVGAQPFGTGWTDKRIDEALAMAEKVVTEYVDREMERISNAKCKDVAAAAIGPAIPSILLNLSSTEAQALGSYLGNLTSQAERNSERIAKLFLSESLFWAISAACHDSLSGRQTVKFDPLCDSRAVMNAIRMARVPHTGTPLADTVAELDEIYAQLATATDNEHAAKLLASRTKCFSLDQGLPPLTWPLMRFGDAARSHTTPAYNHARAQARRDRLVAHTHSICCSRGWSPRTLVELAILLDRETPERVGNELACATVYMAPKGTVVDRETVERVVDECIEAGVADRLPQWSD